MNITDLVHPAYAARSRDWSKWRLTYKGGTDFVNAYLEQFSKSEDADDFDTRKSISYSPSFAKSALIEVRNSIYQRMSDITREGGTPSYQQAVLGRRYGVDMIGSNMNTFIGTEVLPELMSMGKVGIYIDMPKKIGESLSDNLNIRPYLYIYRTEDIRSWQFDDSPTPNIYSAVLLREVVHELNEETGLPEKEYTRFRHYWKQDNKVYVRFYNDDNVIIDPDTNSPTPDAAPIELNITRIPIVILELEESLLTDIADYQISLLNLASSDMMYCVGANFPFYTEQFDPRTGSQFTKSESEENRSEINVGAASGRRYPVNTERPGFIHPSSEPMRASMDKQEQLKLEIRLLLNLAITNIQPKMASAESKGMDERTLESGLSYIGLLLEDAERQIALLWSEYEGSTNIATINYPDKYNLKSDDDRRKDVAALAELAAVVPSDTYKREIAKQIVQIMLANKVSTTTLAKMLKEIDEAVVADVKPELLLKDLEAGLVDAETASEVRGYPEGSVEKAQQEKAQRLKLIQESQTPPGFNPAARGIPDASTNPAEQTRLEKQKAAVAGDGSKVDTTRGPGK